MFEKDRYCQMPNGYEETVRKGLSAVKRFSGQISYGNGSDREQMDRLKKELETADAIVIGACRIIHISRIYLQRQTVRALFL